MKRAQQIVHRSLRCGYRTRLVGGVTAYLAPAPVPAGCHSHDANGHPGPLESYGVDQRQHLLLIGSANTLLRALRVGGGVAKEPSLASVVEPLSGDPYIWVALGDSFCSYLSTPAVLVGENATPLFLHKYRSGNSAGAPYSAFAFGYDLSGSKVTGRIVISYADSDRAQNDLSFREQAARTGVLASSQLGNSNYFAVDRGAVDGNNVVLDVSPPDDGAFRVSELADPPQLPFARC